MTLKETPYDRATIPEDLSEQDTVIHKQNKLIFRAGCSFVSSSIIQYTNIVGTIF